MSLPVPSAYSAQILLTLWVGFLLVAAAGYGLLRWWHNRRRGNMKLPVKNGAGIRRHKREKRAAKRARRGAA